MFKWSRTIFSLGVPVGVPILFTACTFNFNSRSLMPFYYCHDFYLNDPQVLKAFSSENEPLKINMFETSSNYLENYKLRFHMSLFYSDFLQYQTQF